MQVRFFICIFFQIKSNFLFMVHLTQKFILYRQHMITCTLYWLQFNNQCIQCCNINLLYYFKYTFNEQSENIGKFTVINLHGNRQLTGLKKYNTDGVSWKRRYFLFSFKLILDHIKVVISKKLHKNMLPYHTDQFLAYNRAILCNCCIILPGKLPSPMTSANLYVPELNRSRNLSLYFCQLCIGFFI